MIRLLAAAALVLGVGLASTASADPGPGPAGWHLSRASYVAIGGAGGRSAQGQGRRYAASGYDVRGMSAEGHGGFARLEHGDLGLLRDGPQPAAPFVLAFDLGYSFGGPFAGEWERGLLAFLEVGLSGWRSSGLPTDELRPSVDPLSSRAGFGLSYGASVEAQLQALRVGVALQRREIPVFVGDGLEERHMGSTTVQLRVTAEL